MRKCGRTIRRLDGPSPGFWRCCFMAAYGLHPCFLILACGVASVVCISGCKKDRESVESLVASLGDGDQRVRCRAAEALGRTGDARAVEPLIAVLKTSDIYVRGVAAEALITIGQPAVEPLIGALDDGDFYVRFLAATALGTIRDTRAIEPLIKALNDDAEFIRVRAAEALGRMGNKNGVEALIGIVKDGSSGPLFEAMEALGDMGDTRAVEHVMVVLEHESDQYRMKAAEVLDKLGWQPRDERERATYLVAKQDWGECATIGEPALRPLIAVLRYDNPSAYRARSGAAEALGKIGDPRAVEPLVRAPRDSGAATEALVRIGRPAVASLIAALPRVRAVQALGQIGDPSAIEPLMALLDYHDADVRGSAIGALGSIGEPAVEPLVVALRDESSIVRRSAASALGSIGGQKAISSLVAGLPDWFSGTAAARALRSCAWRPQNTEDRVHFAIALRNKKDLTITWWETHRVLLEDVRCKDYRVIANAVYAAVALGREELIDDLCRILDSEGDQTMAESFLNSGNKELSRAAYRWASKRGLSVTEGEGAQLVRWGSW